MTKEQKALLSLHLVPGIGGALVKNLITYFGSARETLQQPEIQLRRVGGIGIKLCNAINQFNPEEVVPRILSRCEKNGIQIIDFQHSLFPQRLLHAYDAPLLLFVKGNNNLNPSRSISIVGTRKATPYGIDFTTRLIRDLEPYRPTIISGLAYGIDITAHAATIREGLPGIGVVASGPDIIYPYNHKTIAQKLTIVSEYFPGDLPDPKKFPARNRIIAGMSDGVVVVEAADKGGALITANQANDYNREVFALPGDIERTYSKGTNNLIKSHKARIITSAEDIAYALGWEKEVSMEKQYKIPETFGEYELKVYKIIQQENEIHIDKLSWLSKIQPGRLASVLLNLEFEGFVKSLPGKKFKLSARRIHV